MITRITGKLVRLGDDMARLEVGAFEYELYVPEFVRRQMQSSLGSEVTLKTIQYIEGNPQGSRLTPRLIGFLSDAEIEFFDLVCSVDGMGVKKTLRAMVRPVREVAEAIEEQNVKELSMLPGIGPAMSERIVAKLRRKMGNVFQDYKLLEGKSVEVDAILPATEAYPIIEDALHRYSEQRRKGFDGVKA